MRFFRTALYALLLQFLWSISGCCCDETIEYRYRWEELRLAHLDNTGTTPNVSTSETLPAAAYGIRMTLTHQQVLSALFHTGRLPTAWATSCEPAFYYIATDTVAELRVIALRNASDPIDVTDDFIAADPGGGSIDSLDQFVPVGAVVEKMNDSPAAWAQLLLIHDTGTFRTEGIRFAVALRMADGRTISDTTTPVTLY